jgi:hypothetical protein
MISVIAKKSPSFMHIQRYYAGKWLIFGREARKKLL